MPTESPSVQTLLAENAELRARLEEAEETLYAIRNGNVDALVVEGSAGQQIFALQGLDAELNRLRGEILEQVSDAVIVLDDDDHITYLNIAAGQQYGVSIAKMLGHNLTEMYQTRWIHPEDEVNATAALAKTAGSWVGENIHIKRNGEVINVEISLSRLHPNSGVLAVIRDINERKKAEENLLRLNRTLQALSKSSRALIYANEETAYLQEICRIIVEDCGHAMVWVGFAENDAMKTVRPVASAGFEEGYLETLRISWADTERGRGPTGTAIRTGQASLCRDMLTDPQFAPWRTEAIKRGYASSAVFPLLIDGRAIGSLTLYSTEPAGFSDDEVQLLTELAGDLAFGITTLRLRAVHTKIEQALRDNEQRMRLATEATSVGIWEWNILTNQIHWDTQMFRIYGIEPTLDGFVQYATWRGRVLPEDLPHQEQEIQKAISQLEDNCREFRILRADDGQCRHIQAVETVRTNAQGQAEWLVGTNLDVTEHKQAEQALKDANRRKDEFLAMLAHELRNPLAPIRNAVEIQKLANTDPSRLAWCNDVIERQVEHLIRLVDDLLDVSRISRGLVELKKEPLEIRNVIQSAVETSQPLIDARRHQFVMTLPPDSLWVEGDRIRLAQVVSNLINNAAKYTEEGGRIELTTELAGDNICIRVTDNGCGIDPADLPNLFDLFYQVDRNLDRSQGGLGIGLSLVHSLVAEHGGHVRAFSGGIGRGSEFEIRLPRLILPEPETVGYLSLPARNLGELRILVVDDNRDALESLAMLLEIDGHQVQTAHDGPAALEMAQAENNPDVIILDIGLPGMNGYSVAQALRRRRETDRTMLIALTGYGRPDDREKSRTAGFDAHLVKPIDFESLRKLLAEHARLGEHQGNLSIPITYSPKT
jgi:PAS domain S-box-containing protein